MLLVPPLDSLDLSAREAAALRPTGREPFSARSPSIATNETGEVVAPFDHSGFRFRHLALVRGANGEAKALRIAVGGQEASRRPNVQIRVVTERGVSAVIDASEGEWILPQDASAGRPRRFSASRRSPTLTHTPTGKRLSADQVRSMKIVDIARLHDRQSSADPRLRKSRRTPHPRAVADLIFSQPMRGFEGGSATEPDWRDSAVGLYTILICGSRKREQVGAWGNCSIFSPGIGGPRVGLGRHGFRPFRRADARRARGPLPRLPWRGDAKERPPLDSLVAALRGGDSGEKTIVPGKSAESYLISLVTSTDKAHRMPPKGDLLTAEEIASLKSWIDQADTWRSAQAELEKKTTDHWATSPS